MTFDYDNHKSNFTYVGCNKSAEYKQPVLTCHVPCFLKGSSGSYGILPTATIFVSYRKYNRRREPVALALYNDAYDLQKARKNTGP